MGEFQLISKLVEVLNNDGCSDTLAEAGLVLGPGDDAALIEPPPGMQLVTTIDTLIEGAHFPATAMPFDIGHKALAVNLSDLAAMGAKPGWYLLALTLPENRKEWLVSFAEGMGGLAARSKIALAGGDTTRGPLSITVTAIGLVPRGLALLRSGARPGNLIVVSGHPGLGALGLRQYQQGGAADEQALTALHRPQPRLELGTTIRGCATACIDLSDGLAADLTHILEASRLGAELWLDRLPLAGPLEQLDQQDAWHLALSGGDDYELCFTWPAECEARLPEITRSVGLPLSVIGRTVSDPGLRLLLPDGSLCALASAGFDHFKGAEH